MITEQEEMPRPQTGQKGSARAAAMSENPTDVL